MRQKDWSKNGDDKEVTFNVKCTMRKCWADEFISFLKHMESLGKAGCSRVVAFYADGDGDFRPKFEHDLANYRETTPTETIEGDFKLFDAG